MAQQTHIVVKDIYVGETVGQDAVEYLAGGNELVQTVFTLTCDDSLLCGGTLTPNLARSGLLECDRQYALTSLRAYLYMVLQKRHLLEQTLFEALLAHIVEGEGQLLLKVVGEVVMPMYISLFLRFDNLLHQLHCGVVFA